MKKIVFKNLISLICVVFVVVFCCSMRILAEESIPEDNGSQEIQLPDNEVDAETEENGYHSPDVIFEETYYIANAKNQDGRGIALLCKLQNLDEKDTDASYFVLLNHLEYELQLQENGGLLYTYIPAKSDNDENGIETGSYTVVLKKVIGDTILYSSEETIAIEALPCKSTQKCYATDDKAESLKLKMLYSGADIKALEIVENSGNVYSDVKKIETEYISNAEALYNKIADASKANELIDVKQAEITVKDLFINITETCRVLSVRVCFTDGEEAFLQDCIEIVSEPILDKCALYEQYDNTGEYFYMMLVGSKLNADNLIYSISDRTGSFICELSPEKSIPNGSGYIVKFKKDEKLFADHGNTFLFNVSGVQDYNIKHNYTDSIITFTNTDAPSVYNISYNAYSNTLDLKVAGNYKGSDIRIYCYNDLKTAKDDIIRCNYAAKGSGTLENSSMSISMENNQRSVYTPKNVIYIAVEIGDYYCYIEKLNVYSTIISKDYWNLDIKTSTAVLGEGNNELTVSKNSGKACFVLNTDIPYVQCNSSDFTFTRFDYDTGKSYDVEVTGLQLTSYTYRNRDYIAIEAELDFGKLDTGIYDVCAYYKGFEFYGFDLYVTDKDSKFLIADLETGYDYKNQSIVIDFYTNRHYAEDEYVFTVTDPEGNAVTDISARCTLQSDTGNHVQYELSGDCIGTGYRYYYVKIQHKTLADENAYYLYNTKKLYFDGYGIKVDCMEYDKAYLHNNRIYGVKIADAVYPVSMQIENTDSETIMLQTVLESEGDNVGGNVFIPGEIRDRIPSDEQYTLRIIDAEGKSLVYNNVYLDTKYMPEIPDKNANIKGYAAELKDVIALKFYVSVSDGLVDADKLIRYSIDGKTEEVHICEKETFGEIEVLAYEIPVSATKIASQIHVEFIADGSTYCETTYSVKEYLNAILADDTKTIYHNLAKAILNYGTYAQLYFNYNILCPANDGIEDTVADTRVVMDEKYMHQGLEASNTTACKDIWYYGASLICKDRPYMKLYFEYEPELTEGSIRNDYKLVLHREGDLLKEGTDYTVTFVDHNRFVIKVSDIYISTVKDTYDIKVINKKDESDAIEMAYSAYGYIYKALQNKNDKLKNLVKALYLYSEEYEKMTVE